MKRGGEARHVPFPRVILCDLDGVVWRGEQVLEENVRRLVAWARRVPVVFLTNNSTRHHTVVEDRLQRLGFPQPRVITSAGVAAWALRVEGIRRVLVVGEEGLRREVREAGGRIVWRQAEVVLVGMDRRVSYRKLNRAFLELQRGARFWATNLDVAYPAPEGLHLGAGALVASLQAAWGPPERHFGKPSPEMFRRALDLVGVDPGPHVWMVGDRLDTDVEGAVRMGFTPVLVLTGVTSRVPDTFEGVVGIPLPPGV